MTETRYSIVEVFPEQLASSTIQPSGREGGAAQGVLKRSIMDHGLQYPPLVTRNPEGDGYTIIDGHRRVAAMNALKWQKIPVMVAQGRSDDLFAAVCGTTKPLTANQWVEVYLKGGALPSIPTSTAIKKLEATVGREFLEKLNESGVSPAIWNLANRVVRYAQVDDEKKPKVLWWLLTHKLTRDVSSWITNDDGAAELRKAFDENRAPSNLRHAA